MQATRNPSTFYHAGQVVVHLDSRLANAKRQKRPTFTESGVRLRGMGSTFATNTSTIPCPRAGLRWPNPFSRSPAAQATISRAGARPYCLQVYFWRPITRTICSPLAFGDKKPVFAPAACQRLPELALLAANILTHLAATLPPIPTGFWDRHPQKHQGACDGPWRRLIFPKRTLLTGDFEKNSRLRPTCPKEMRLIAG